MKNQLSKFRPKSNEIQRNPTEIQLKSNWPKTDQNPTQKYVIFAGFYNEFHAFLQLKFQFKIGPKSNEIQRNPTEIQRNPTGIPTEFFIVFLEFYRIPTREGVGLYN